MESLITPHGGQLVNLMAEGEKQAEALRRSSTSKKILLSHRSLSDIQLLSNGAYSPLKGFMNSLEYIRVLEENRLTNGLIFPLPINLPVDEETAHNLNLGEEVALIGRDGLCYALLEVEDIYEVDQQAEAEILYGTTNLKHQGVINLYGQSPIRVAGPIQVIRYPSRSSHEMDPYEVRNLFIDMKWKKIVGFQTFGLINRGHEYIQKCALEMVDGLLIQPIMCEIQPIMSCEHVL